MNDAFGVGGVESVSDLNAQFDRGLDFEGPSGDAMGEGYAL